MISCHVPASSALCPFAAESTPCCYVRRNLDHMPVTRSRDTDELPFNVGCKMMSILRDADQHGIYKYPFGTVPFHCPLNVPPVWHCLPSILTQQAGASHAFE